MNRIVAGAVVAALWVLVPVSAGAQPQSQLYCRQSATGPAVPVSPDNPCPVKLEGGGDVIGGAWITGTTDAAGAITSVVSPSAEATRVLKASAGNLYSVYATNLTATAGYLVVVNAISAPADGAIAPLACVPLPGNGIASIDYAPGPAQRYSTGIVAVVSSASTCFTKTTGTITALISGAVQ